MKNANANKRKTKSADLSAITQAREDSAKPETPTPQASDYPSGQTKRRLLCQNEIVGRTITVRWKEESNGLFISRYFKAFIPGCELRLDEDYFGCGRTPASALLDLARKLSEIPPRENVFTMMDREEMEISNA